MRFARLIWTAVGQPSNLKDKIRGRLLEVHPERELDISLAAADSAALRRDLSEVRARRIEVDATTAATAPIRVVDEVESFSAELKALIFGERKRFEETEIPVLKSRLMNDIADILLRECARSGRGEDRRAVRVLCREPLSIRSERFEQLRITVDRVILAIDAAAKVGIESDAREVSGLRNTTRCTCLELRDAADLPATQKFAAQRRVVAEKRQPVDVVDIHDVADVEL